MTAAVAPATPFGIRAAVLTDVERLVEIEVSAGQAFRTVGLATVAADAPDPAHLRRVVAAGRVWVAEAGEDTAAYIVAELLDGNAHIAQVSVAAEHAGRRIGRALMDHVENWGRDRHCPATTLTTFRDVPWNAPYYTRLGYRVLDPADIGPDLARTIAHENTLPGLDQAPRCAMIKVNRPAGAETGRVRVRPATPADAATVRTLVGELAAHQQQSEHVTADVIRWQQMLARAEVTVLLAELDDAPVGYVSAVRRLHLWSGDDVIALDDLYVRPGHRDRGIGEQLMHTLAARTGDRTISWSVQPDNHAAVRFYERLGATHRTKVVCAWPTSARPT